MKNVEKFIRILGYTVYLILWLPVLVVLFPIVAIAMPVMLVRAGYTVKEAIVLTGKSFVVGIQHDVHYINTGDWI